jgi:hypothetical protein
MILKRFLPCCGFRLGILPVLLTSAVFLIAMQTAAVAEESVILPNPIPAVEPASDGGSPSAIMEPAPVSESASRNEAMSETTAPPALELAQPELDPVSKRLFGVIPNYRADQLSPTYKPLTTAEKYKIAHDDSFDWPNFPLLVGYTLQAQVASGGFKHNGGLTGFGEFYARGAGDQVIGSYLTEAILPGALHEDPRFFRIGTGTFFHRIYYAASRVIVTRKDDGHTGFYISEVIGNMGVVAVTSLYYPASQTAARGAERYAMQLGNDAVSNILTEFWPDIKHRLRFVQRYLLAH